MKVIFEENNLESGIKKAVQTMLENHSSRFGNVILEYIPDDEVECYDCEFSEKYGNFADIYIVYKIVAGAWNQPISMVAVMD